MRHQLLAVLLLASVPALSWAQSTGGVLTPLPAPDLPADSPPSAYLRAAQGLVAADRGREAESALEMAQTRMLDRSVALGQTNSPSDNPTILQITQARQALAAHDLTACQQAIQAAIATATAQGL
jgi:hypothetical protein